MILSFILLVLLQTAPPVRPRNPNAPNLNRLAETGQSITTTRTLEVRNPEGRTVVQIDYKARVCADSRESSWIFMLPGGDIYDLRLDVAPRGDGTHAVLRLPDSSSVAMRYQEDPRKAVLTYAKLSAPLDANASHKKQYMEAKARELRAALPESGSQLVALLDHARGDLCRQVSLCGGFADALLDLFRRDEDVEADVDTETENESGWTVKVLSSSRTIDPVELPK